MNELIKKLSNQAYDELVEETGNIVVFDEDLQQRFAELIVKECVSVLTLTVAEGSALKMNLSGHMLKLVTGIGKQYANGIKEHFGIKNERTTNR